MHVSGPHFLLARGCRGRANLLHTPTRPHRNCARELLLVAQLGSTPSPPANGVIAPPPCTHVWQAAPRVESHLGLWVQGCGRPAGLGGLGWVSSSISDAVGSSR